MEHVLPQLNVYKAELVFASIDKVKLTKAVAKQFRILQYFSTYGNDFKREFGPPLCKINGTTLEIGTDITGSGNEYRVVYPRT